MPTFIGFDCYGGATITRVVDGAQAEWIGVTARNLATNTFGFFVFRDGVNVPIAPVCTGRGSLNNDGHWIAWNGSTWQSGALPGWTPIVTTSGGDRAPVAIPPGGAIANLWPLPYSAAEVDSPEEIAIRLSKTKAAVLELIELLKQAGVLA